MEATTNCNQNREIVAEKLNRQAEARREAIRRQEEAHERYERAMINAVNKHASNARNTCDVKPSSNFSESEKNENVRKLKRKRSIKRVIADGEDYILQICICSGGLVLSDILFRFGAIPIAEIIALRVLLVAFFAITVYRLHYVLRYVSYAISKYTEEE